MLSQPPAKSIFDARDLTLPPERELSQLAAPPKNQLLRIEDNPRSAPLGNTPSSCDPRPASFNVALVAVGKLVFCERNRS